MEHNMDTDKDNRNDDDILLGVADFTPVIDICHKQKHPCDPEPKCPTTPCDPSTVRLQCCSQGIFFKLSCTKLPPDCDHPEARYDCDLIDEGRDIDTNILAACDLKCERIQAIHGDHPIVIEDDIEIAQIQGLTNLVYSKDVNFSGECTNTPPDSNQPSDERFLCEIRAKSSERKMTTAELQSTPIKCSKLYNMMDDSVLGDTDAKDYFTIENLHNPLLTSIGKGQEDNLETLINNDDNDHRLFNQFKEDNIIPKHTACSYKESVLPFNSYDESEENAPGNINLICASPPEPTPSSPLSTPICHEISDLLENNKLIYACRSKPNMDKVDNKCNNNTNESVKLDCIEQDEFKLCEEQPFVGSSENIEIYTCNKPNPSPEQDNKSCAEESLINQLTSSLIQHHNTTVKLIKVAANDLLCLIGDSSKDTSNESKDADLHGINAVIEFTKDTINAVTAQTNKLLGSENKCEDNEPKITEPKVSKLKICPTPRKISSIDFIESTEGVIDNKPNKNVLPDHEESLNDDTQIPDEPTVKTTILIKESQDIHGKVYETTKHISDEPTQGMTDVLISLTNDVKNKITEDPLEIGPPYMPTPPREISCNFDSDEYSYDSDDSAPKRNIFATLKDKIRAMFYDHNSTDYSTSACSSASTFSEYSDDDHVPPTN